MSFTEEQAQFLIQTAIEQKQAITEQKQAITEQKQFNAYVAEKLEKIESHVIMIHGKVVSDFHGIEPDTKKEIESIGQMTELTPEEINEHEELIHPKNKTKQAVQYRKMIAYYSAAKELRTYGKPLSKGEAIAVGNWTSGIITKMFGKNFKGKYPKALRPLVSSLVGYYAVERKSERMY
ncbi:MAG: hypothetical protein ACEQSC_00145 [Candidatus Nanopelagicaceae bacterium]